ncbi:MJ0042-type zinc finger domain-containing protein [Ruminococcus sp. YE282]|uniref:MJ0042-type zinc finger domain-containing protein n=1 Tax=Ruminococcus sp. YE282 TaxID=3158780 RepID=UPI0008903333|nr:MJ0042-type zinc finger domain-containing protein [Ruminococcus bromii]MEE0964042.1 MJ0042-type zinc finger domain-containing protein [Ruminococcus bromii]MEE3499218.1 MJ0042-type zinc finger domain-containing protein [Ruminococcus bromii]SCY48010.1 MJ0042 family finger-like domain-containing protein [Ruminococcus bromii]
MRNFLQKITIFMQGRYGTDTLNNCLTVLFFIIWFVKIFIFNRLARLIILAFQIALLALILFRALSRNITKRSAENRKFVPVYNAVKNWCQLTWKKFKDRKEYRYLKCPVCKAQLRVKNQKGVHTVRCPRCGSEFEKKI